MTGYAFETVDVFTDRRFGGNPLAVVLGAQGLDTAAMQAVAREFNYAETTFVLPPSDPANTAQVRIFTPVVEMPFAGHPNVGTAYVLARARPELGEALVFEELAGLVRVTVTRDAAGAVVSCECAAPGTLTLGINVPAATIAACVGLAEADVREDAHRPVQAGVGVDIAIAELTDRDALSRAAPDLGAFRAMVASQPGLAAHPAIHLYVRDADEPGLLHARMFAPLMGVPEDPATGSANATLAALLASLAPGADVRLAFAIRQGDDMGRPSRLIATATKQAEAGVTATVGGGCVPVMRGTIEV